MMFMAKIITVKEVLEPYFYPLDTLLNWNRIYGKRGFFQYQCVLPGDDLNIVKELLLRVSQAKMGWKLKKSLN